MNFLTLSPRRIFLLLFGLHFLVIPMESVSAGECAIADPAKADNWKACEGKPVKVTGDRASMDEVPPDYAAVDPSFSGGSGFQDYLTFDKKSYVILRTKDSVDCPEKIEVEGTLKYLDIKGEKVRTVEVTKLTCK